ncbi:NAD(P)-binding protein [Lentinus brumalis]|uniref:NAD(P)-binding protein n=1 Tax=Lentinus brumalis TaxID=2498619 RepID=A0A371CTZ7_9APHY|nr:NAD(P)-binding protein [Polyporus brumalis]
MVRAGSALKPETLALRDAGVEIRIGDLEDDLEQHMVTLQGVYVLISAVSAFALDKQETIILAAKEVGVGRVIPCDWGTPGAKGVRELHDQKLAIRELIQEIGVPYTFIDVGWWMQPYLPLPVRSSPEFTLVKGTTRVVGPGGAATNVRILVTHRDHIGTFVARIIADPRTLNKAVIIWEDQVSQNDAHEIGARVSGDGDKMKETFLDVTPEELLSNIEQGKAMIAKEAHDMHGHLLLRRSEHRYSLHVLGENTLENTKRLGYLDARELYPDIRTTTLEEFAKEFYAAEDPTDLYYPNRKV